MATKHMRLNNSQNPNSQSKQVSRDDTTHLLEQQTIPDRLPNSLVD